MAAAAFFIASAPSISAPTKGCENLTTKLIADGIEEYSRTRLTESPENSMRPPEDVPYLVLGFHAGPHSTGGFSSATIFETFCFARGMEKVLNHNAVIYSEMTAGGLVDGLSQTTSLDVNRALERLLGTPENPGIAKGAKAALVNLDGFEASHPKGYGNGRGEFKNRNAGIFARELHYILSNPHFLKHSRFFRSGRELSLQEVQADFGKYYPEVHSVSVP